MPNRYALIIGNSEYSDSKLARLRTPDSDVNALADVLRNPGLGSFDEVEVLLNHDSTLVRKTITKFFSNKKRDDLLLLYFSGHGVLDDRGRLFLAVKDTEHHLLRGTSLPANFITDEMDNSNSKRQILILDCCHSGAFARGTKGAVGKSVGTSSAFMGNGYGRVVLTATDSTEYAWEGEQLLGSKQNSVFTHYLIQGIETGQADLDQDGLISIDELFDFAHDRVSSSTSKQTPGKWSFRQHGEIILAQNPFVLNASGTQVSRTFEGVKPSVLIGPSLSWELWIWGTVAGLLTALLLIYPFYIYLPSLYVSGWYKGYAVLAYLLMFAALVPPAWSGWQMARRAKSGWDAVFLGAEAGALASAIAFVGIIAMASEVFAFGPILKLLPTTMGSNQINVVLASPMIAVFNKVVYSWLAVALAGFLAGALGGLFKLQRSGEKINFSSFSVMFDMHWWKMIVVGMVSALLVQAISIPFYGELVDQVTNTSRVARYQVPPTDQTFLNGFPYLPSLIGLLSTMLLSCISTLGSVPDKPSQQRLIALYALIAALLPWINPLLGRYPDWEYESSSSMSILIILLCAVSSGVLLFFAVRLIRKSGWGQLETTSGRAFLATQMMNAFLLLMLATPAIVVGVFYYSVVLGALEILNGISSITVKALVSTGFKIHFWANLSVITFILILYTLLGLLLKPLLWAYNGIVGLFSQPDVRDQPAPGSALAEPLPLTESADQPVTEGSKDVPLWSPENMRLFKAAGLILGVPLLLLIGLRLFSRPPPPQASQTLQPTNTPVIAFFPNVANPTGSSATKTLAAAFTQLASNATTSPFKVVTITAIATITDTPTVTPITTLTPTGAILHLDKSSTCRIGPADEYDAIVSLASGVELPILASSTEHEGWWLVMVRLSVSTNAVCWIENGTVEGSTSKIPAIVYTP
jgi:hypothetical protein